LANGLYRSRKERELADSGSGIPLPDFSEITGLLIDIDGTLHEAGVPVEGVSEAIAELRSGLPLLFTTNTSRMPRSRVAAELRALGIRASEEEILTATVAAARWLQEEGIGRVQLLAPPAVREDFEEFRIVQTGVDGRAGGAAEAVVVADMGGDFTFEVLNSAFRSLREGALLVAIHRNRYWLTQAGPTLDAGPFVAALEYAAGIRAVLVGKPAPAFFEMAARLLGVERGGLVVVGDDPETDITGAHGAGLEAIQVRTGKSREVRHATGTGPAVADEANPSAALTIASIAELPAAVARGIG
jgi:HAD superfamily hydrolase (TIGR01458 family)